MKNYIVPSHNNKSHFISLFPRRVRRRRQRAAAHHHQSTSSSSSSATPPPHLHYFILPLLFLLHPPLLDPSQFAAIVDFSVQFHQLAAPEAWREGNDEKGVWSEERVNGQQDEEVRAAGQPGPEQSVGGAAAEAPPPRAGAPARGEDSGCLLPLSESTPRAPSLHWSPPLLPRGTLPKR